MTNRELLEYAARAIGICNAEWYEAEQCIITDDSWVDSKYCGGRYLWNPLENDADCARMEADLGANLLWGKNGVMASFGKRDKYIKICHFSEFNNNKQSARRYASTYVAALIGKSL